MPDVQAQAALPRQAELALAIARYVPITVLAEAVAALDLDPNFMQKRKEAPSDPTEARAYLANHAVELAAGLGVLERLASELARRLWLDGEAVSALYPFTEDPGDDAAKQAAIAMRANTLRMPELRENMQDWEAWICLIVAELPDGTVRGTGLLVSPDLVLTTYHTVKRHLRAWRDEQPQPGELYAVFDYLREAGAVGAGDRDEPVRVDFAPAGERPPADLNARPGWLFDHCADLARDGLDPDPDPATPDDLTLRQSSLDYVLLRLKEPVGSQARRPGNGGPRRRWLQLQMARHDLRHDDRIIIPQHPNGKPQRIDFGRFSAPHTEPDRSRTRIRYDTETEKGTSGAPCFNQSYDLVGLHNASFEPNGTTQANQAIRLQCIAERLQANPLTAKVLQRTPPPRGSMVWSASAEPGRPRVVIGRRTLSTWIDAAAADAPVSRAERIYAAEARATEGRSTSGFGKSFSVEILKAARRHNPEPILVLGTEEALLPATAPDVLAAIALQLQVPSDEMTQMPPRPGSAAASAMGVDDKLSRWASEELPRWFDGVLGRRRTIKRDLRAETTELIALYERLGRPVPTELQEADRDATAVDSRWPRVWIALDRLNETRISDEVRALLGGLTGANMPEASLRPELRRLRWLFLGFRPDFLALTDVTTELLDPSEVGAADCVATLRGLAAALGKDLSSQSVKDITEVLEALIGLGSPFEDVNRRLGLLQESLAKYAVVVERGLRA